MAFRLRHLQGALLIVAAWFVYSPAFRGDWLWDDFELRENPNLRDWSGLAKLWYAPHTPDYYPVKATAQWIQYQLWGENLLGYHLVNAACHVLAAFLLWRVLNKLMGSRVPSCSDSTSNKPTSSDPKSSDRLSRPESDDPTCDDPRLSDPRWSDPSRAACTAVDPVGQKAPWRQAAPPLAGWLAALLFIVHPLAVESVAWISELKNTLSLVFLLLSFSFWLNLPSSDVTQASPPAVSTAAGGTPAPSKLQARPPALRSYLLSLVLFLAALLTKSSVIMLPPFLLLHAWWRRGRIAWSDLRATLPFFAVSLALGALTVHLQVSTAIARWNLPKATFPARLANAGRAIAFYFEKCVYPRHLMPVYPPWHPHSGPLQFWPWVVIVAVFAVLFLAAKKLTKVERRVPAPLSPPELPTEKRPEIRLRARLRRDKPGRSTFSPISASARATILALGFFLLFLLPILGFLPMSYQHIAPVADHLCYIPLVAIVSLAAAGIAHLFRPIDVTQASSPAVSPKEGLRPALFLVLTALVLLLALSSRSYASIFLNQETMWTYNLAHNRQSPAVYINLGFTESQDGDYPAAIAHYEQAIRLDPDDAQAEDELAGVYMNQANAAAAAVHFDRAIAHYQRALRIDPGMLPTRRKLAFTLDKAGRTSEAIAQYEQVLREDPADPQTENNLGKALDDAGRRSEAFAHFQAALRLAPAYPEAENSLGLALTEDGRPQEGIRHLQEALRLDPDLAEAENNLGFALAGMGRQQDAVGHFEEALRLKPAFGQAENNLGFALAALGRTSEAISHFEHALQLAPDDPKAHYNLAVLLAASGKPADAIAHLETALKLKPDFPAAEQKLRELRIQEIANGR